MRRRDFNLALLRASASAILAPHLFARAMAQDSSVPALYSNAIIIDSLCAPGVNPESPSPESLAAVRQSGITAVNFSISVPDSEETLYNLANVQKLVDDSPDVFYIVRRHSDLALCKREHKLGIMMGFQYPQVLEAEPERISTYRKLGVRIMQLTYNNRSSFGDGCMEAANQGLSNQGKLAIETMNEIGVALDLSHSGYRTTSEGISQSSKPVLVTHAGCAAVYAHPRNKPDEILKSLADRGGYFGVYLMPYLVASPTVPTREHVLNHLLHAINVCGADHVGIGSDGVIPKMMFPSGSAATDPNVAQRQEAGIGAPGEDRFPYVPDLNGPDHMQIIAAELVKRGQPASVIEKVLGANFQRVIGEIWGSS